MKYGKNFKSLGKMKYLCISITLVLALSVSAQQDSLVRDVLVVLVLVEMVVGVVGLARAK